MSTSVKRGCQMRQQAIRRKQLSEIPPDLNKTEAYDVLIRKKVYYHCQLKALAKRASDYLNKINNCHDYCPPPEIGRYRDYCILYIHKHWDAFKPFVDCVKKEGNYVKVLPPLSINKTDIDPGLKVTQCGTLEGLYPSGQRQSKRDLKLMTSDEFNINQHQLIKEDDSTESSPCIDGTYLMGYLAGEHAGVIQNQINPEYDLFPEFYWA